MSEPSSAARAILCPYCGDRQIPAAQCRSCGGLFDRWSICATQNDMGAWFVRDSKRPHFVGFSYEALAAAIRAGEIGRDAIVRGPTTRQFWTLARRAPGLAHLFGRCHACQGAIPATARVGAEAPSAASDSAQSTSCDACGAAVPIDGEEGGLGRNFLGLSEIEPVLAPRAAKPDLDAFVLDSGLLICAATAVTPSVRATSAPTAAAPSLGAEARGVQAPKATAPQSSTTALAPLEPIALAPVGPAPVIAVTVTTSRFEHTSTAVTSSASRPQSAMISPIDRTLAERARHLERVNRVLVGSTVCAVAFMLLFGIAYFVTLDHHEADIARAQQRGAEAVRAEFAKTAPVVTPPSTQLPELPPSTPEVSGPAVPRPPAESARIDRSEPRGAPKAEQR